MQNIHKTTLKVPGTAGSLFVLEAIDLSMQCIVQDAQFAVVNPQVLADIVGVSSILPHQSYFLDPEDVTKINAIFGLSFETSMTMEVSIRQAQPIDQLPYEVHTNRELFLMLAGEKPLASFMGSPAIADDPAIPEKFFDPYVAEGRFRKRDVSYVVSSSVKGARDATIRHVLYALNGEEWRIDEYIWLMRKASVDGWSELLTRKEGSLLGYADWQNDAFIERIYRPSVLETVNAKK